MAPINLFDLYAKISLDTKEYKKAVSDATKESRGLSEKFQEVAKSSETTKNKIKLLASQYSAAKADVEKLTDAFNKSAKENGYASEETENLAQELSAAEEKAAALKSELDDLSNEARGAGDSASKMSDGFTVAKGVLADLISNGIQKAVAAFSGLVSAIWNLDQTTEEYRIAQGKLNTAFDAAGMGAGAAQQAYSAFYGILGDTDTATEASQLLAKLARSEQDIATWTDIAAGVFGTFGDSLPIEGLIESANETAKVGQVTGSLADALNWTGISEDDFNKKLAACTTESERNRLIMDTLAGTYDEASDAFYRNNDALVQSRSAQQQAQDAIAQIGGAVSQVKTAFLTKFAPALAAVAPQIANFISGIDISSLVNGFSQFVGFFVNNGPTIISAVAGIGAAFATWKVTSLISGIVSSLTSLFVPATVAATTAQRGLNVAMKANPIGAIITLVVSLVTVIVTLWTTNEGFRDAVGAIWEAIKGFFLSAKDAIVAAWSTVKDFFSGVWEGIKGAFSAVKEFFSERFQQARQASEAAWDGISSFFSSVWEGIKGVFSAVRDFFSEKFQSAKEAAQSAWDGITNFFSGVWEDIKGVFSNAFNAFLDIGSAIVNGIKNGISRGWSALTGWVSDKAKSLLNAAKSALGINSPSRAFRDVVGMMIPAGIAVGVDKGMPSALDAMSNMANRLLEAGSVEVPEPAIRDVNALDMARVSFSDSGIGRSSAGIINGISSAVQNSGQNGPITLNLVLPDGTKLATYLFDPLTKYAKANGTPILNPT